jgi:hypothetical protein
LGSLSEAQESINSKKQPKTSARLHAKNGKRQLPYKRHTNKFSPTRADDKTAEEYQLEGGATLHLVLALRGGRS